jgi:hypothetical protein
VTEILGNIRSEGLSVEEVEEDVRRQLLPFVRSYVELADRASSTIHRTLDVATPAEQASLAANVRMMLLVRIVKDLRAVTLLGERGYVQQAWTLASSLAEVAYDVGFIGASEERAERWTKHEDLKRRPWSVYDAIGASLRALNQDISQLEPAYREYCHLCLAKHGNPAMQKFAGITRTDAGHRVHIDTYASDAVTVQVRVGLCYAVRPALFAIAATVTHQPSARAEFEETKVMFAECNRLLARRSDFINEATPDSGA